MRNFSFSLSKPKPLVIYSLDARGGYTCGFADRLRGMISSYAYAKAINHSFRIDHVEPFELCRFFEPNEVNWKLAVYEKKEIFPYCIPIHVMDNDKGERIPYIPHFLQTHFYTNRNFIECIRLNRPF